MSEIYTIAQHSNICVFIQTLPASLTVACMAGVAELDYIIVIGATAYVVIMGTDARVSVHVF